MPLERLTKLPIEFCFIELASRQITIVVIGVALVIRDIKSKIAVLKPQRPRVSGRLIWGAGATLFAPTNTGFIIGHGGKSPYLNSTVRFDPKTGDGFIMFQTGNEEAFASNMATQWTLWKTGKPDIYLINNRMGMVIRDGVIGAIIIFIALVLIRISAKKSRV